MVARYIPKLNLIFIAALLAFSACDKKSDSEPAQESKTVEIPDALKKPLGPRTLSEKANPAEENSPAIYEPPTEHIKMIDTNDRFVMFVPKKFRILAQNEKEFVLAKKQGGAEYLQRINILEKTFTEGEKTLPWIRSLFEDYSGKPGYTTTRSNKIQWPYIPGGKVWRIRGRWQATDERLSWFTVIAFEHKDKIIAFTANQDSITYSLFGDFLFELAERMLPPPVSGFDLDYKKDRPVFPKTVPGNPTP